MPDSIARTLAAMLLAGALLACHTTTEKSSAPARPGLDDAYLDRLVGDWSISRAIRGTTVRNEMHARWVLGHQFVELRMRDVRDPPEYEALVLIGFDGATKQYVAHWCDTFGGGYSAMGRGTRADDRVEFRFDYADGPFFNTFTWHPADGIWTFRGENGRPDGTRSLFMEDTARRGGTTPH